MSLPEGLRVGSALLEGLRVGSDLSLSFRHIRITSLPDNLQLGGKSLDLKSLTTRGDKGECSICLDTKDRLKLKCKHSFLRGVLK